MNDALHRTHERLGARMIWMTLWLAASVSAALTVAIDLLRQGGQKMWIMNVVWPVTALWAGPIGAWAYFRFGRAADQRIHTTETQPFGVIAAKATTHCGAGCTIADVLAAGLALAVPFSIAGHAIFGEWVYGLIAAFGFGIAFQYFTIKPMRGLSRRAGLIAAVKADALSLAAWQVGMYGWMALARFAIIGHPLAKSSPVFWIMMQVAMLAGFIASYPVNVVLLQHGMKEPM